MVILLLILLALPYDYNTTERRIRCLGHILNLVVQDFLCVKDIEQAEGASLDEIDSDQRLGALGKLHNLAVTFTRILRNSSDLRPSVMVLHYHAITQLGGVPGIS